jgi:D-3-phosphoglycerate dehydrogenase
MKVLVTSSSFWNTPGKHQDLLKANADVVDYKGGPMSKAQLQEIEFNYDGIVCGDDEYDAEMMAKLQTSGVKILSKYGVGLDKMDLEAAKSNDVAVRNCRGVNQTTVAEHVFALLLANFKAVPEQQAVTRAGEWKRKTGRELRDKTLGIIGLGGIGKEVAKLANAFGMKVMAFDKFWDDEFVKAHSVQKVSDPLEIAKACDVVSLHCNLDAESRGLVGADFFAASKQNLVLINTARAGLVDRGALEKALETSRMSYLADVWFEEPSNPDDVLLKHERVYVTPHIGSRTFENVEKQGLMAVENLLAFFKENSE